MEPLHTNMYTNDDPYKHLFENTVKKTLKEYEAYGSYPQPIRSESPNDIISPSKMLKQNPARQIDPSETDG